MADQANSAGKAPPPEALKPDEFLNPGALTDGKGGAGAAKPVDQAKLDAAMANARVQAGTSRDADHPTEHAVSSAKDDGK